MRPYWILACLLLALTVLAGCGQKGPLYLPGNEEAAETYDPAGDTYGSQPEPEPDNDIDADDTTSSSARE